MNIKIIDDALPLNYAKILRRELMVLPHTFNEYSLDEISQINDDIRYSNSHLTHNLNEKEYRFNLNTFLNYILSHINSDGENISISDITRVHTNMQFPGVGGKTYHHDNTYLTAIWCASENNGGSFEYIDENQERVFIDDKFNRLIIFKEPSMPHKGNPPINNNAGPRLNVAIKVKPK